MVNVYRGLNNPWLDRLLGRYRAALGSRYHAKGATAARAMVAALKRGDSVGILVDQKLNEGIALPFFGRDAMTSTAPAKLALRFRAPVLCIRLERLGGANFRLTVRPPLPLPDSGDADADTESVTRQINAVVEGWIRERPEQWLWLHRRWPREERATAPASGRRRVPDRGGSRTS